MAGARAAAPPKHVIYLETDCGTIGLAERNSAITDLFFTAGTTLTRAIEKPTPLLKKTARQVREFLEGRRRVFNLPVSLSGSDFDQLVLRAVMTIPYGQVRSYKEIAEQIGRPRAARAVGSANSRCPISIISPCHRVVRHDGSLAGDPADLQIRQHLLHLESRAEPWTHRMQITIR